MKRHFLFVTVAMLLALLAAGLMSRKVKATVLDSDEQYLSPSDMALSADGRWLYVVCERSDELRVLDTQSGRVTGRIHVGHVPRSLAVSPDGATVYVTNSWDDTLTVIDARSAKVLRTFATGAEPISVATDRVGTMIYVANRISNDVSVIDAESGIEKRRLLAGRGASYLTLSPDGARIYCTHIYPNSSIKDSVKRTPPESEITILDTARQSVVDRMTLPKVAGVFHIALSQDGRLGVAAEMRPKNLVPLAHVAHGWAIGNALTLFGTDLGGQRVNVTVQVPIDELDRFYSLPWGVAIAPDKSQIFVSTSGSDSVTAISVPRLLAFARTQRKPFVNDLSASANYVTARIDVGKNPRGLVMSPDGARLYVANRLDDNIDVIDARTHVVDNTWDLGGPKKLSALRRGEQLFHTAKFSFGGQFGCANCHIDSTFDALTWDLEPDGFGKDIVDNRLLEDIRDTEPFKWNGGNPDLPTECGPRTEKYFFRSQSFDFRELTDLVLYVRSLPLRPNRFRLPHGELTPAQERGKAIFVRNVDKFGKPIAQQNQCSFCHSGKKYTSQKQFDVGTGKNTDRSPIVDTPQLTNVELTAPYLHDGTARSLEEIWTIFNPKDQHGRTNDLTKDELNDLIEYLRTL